MAQLNRRKKQLLVLGSFLCLGMLQLADNGSRDSIITLAWAGENSQSIARNKDALPLFELESADNLNCRAELAPQHARQQLRRDGRWLVDRHGRVVLLHGINTIWKTRPYHPPASAKGFIDQDAQWLRGHGFNSARIGVLFPGVMPARGEINHQYLEAWDRVVQLMANQEIWMLFDFHQDMYSEKFQGNGFPAWAVFETQPRLQKASYGFPRNYLIESVQRQYDLLYANADDIWSEYGEAWQVVAARWKDQNYSLGYDLMNEPWPGTDWLACANPLAGCSEQDRQLQAFFDAVRKDIRKVDADNLVWYEPFLTFDFGVPSTFGRHGKIDDEQVGFSYHSYCLTSAAMNMAGVSGLPGCKAQHSRVAQQAERTSHAMGAASLMTEFGANQDIRDMRQATAVADENLVGWMYWHYKDWKDPTTQSNGRGEQSLFKEDGNLASARQQKLRILSRAYPQFTAGIPGELSFDPDSGEMHYRYTPRQTGARTELYMPVDVHYPWGYKVIARGVETFEIAEDGKRLLVTEQPGACQITIRIEALRAS